MASAGISSKDNVLLLEKNKELENLSIKLGFERGLFLDEIILIKEQNKKILLRKIQEAKKQKKIVICQPLDEELLRFVLERTEADMVIGMENIHPQDSVHYVRGGLDQILCRIAAEQGKIMGFSFQEILNSKNRSRLMARMRFNMELCRKYKVKMVFSNFSTHKEEMRSQKDLQAFQRVLEKG